MYGGQPPNNKRIIEEKEHHNGVLFYMEEKTMANTKTYPHAVIYNGVFYPANTPIKGEKPIIPNAGQVEKPKTKKAVKKNDNERTV